MGIAEKIAGAKKASWITDGLTEAEVKTAIELAKISARIERCRLDLGMTQQEFAKYIGVTQSMVSKWEGREYNFTIRTLNEICEKVNLDLSISLDKTCGMSNYGVIRWDEEKGKMRKSKKNTWNIVTSNKEAIA
ncbi:MAG: helix-turn-helix transcriptional regulator [Butyrivibrio sp.]|nr:helix-turn-helix transcriptional regulator [Butyrivibrio sp.]